MHRKSALGITPFFLFLLSAFVFIGCGSDHGGTAQKPGLMYDPGLCAQAIQAARQSDCRDAWETWTGCTGPKPCMCPQVIINCSSLYDDLFEDCGCGLQGTYAYAKQQGDKQVTDAIELYMPASQAVSI